MSHTITHLVRTIDPTLYTTIVYEVLDEKNLQPLHANDIPGYSQDIVMSNLAKKAEDRKKTLSYHKENQTIVLFFPDTKDLLDARCDFFRTLEDKTLYVPSVDEELVYEAITLTNYRYQTYLTKKKEISISLLVSSDDMMSLLESKTPLYNAIIWARDMINMPPRDMNPVGMIREILGKKWNHFDIHVFDKSELQKIGCNLLLAVGAGSANPPYMLILTPKNPPKTEKYAFVGKGVTFDAGGIQIKPDTAMLDMKCDMSGAAGVLGVARYLDTLQNLPVDVTFAVGLTENMTGDDAYKPLDIYIAYNGTTVEIHHTDAEGRLVLADVMSYVEKNYKPQHIITMATLTGACIYALGYDIAGIMGDDETVIQGLMSHETAYEKLWRLPQNEKIKKSLKAEIADLKNITKTEKAGSSIGGAFLSYFQGDAHLTHLDIAGPAYRETTWGYMPKGGTGWGVKILSEYIMSISTGK